MSFKMSGADFKLLSDYIEKRAKGADVVFNLQQNAFMEVKLTNNSDEPVTIQIYPCTDNGNTSFAKISVSRRLGDEIK